MLQKLSGVTGGIGMSPSSPTTNEKGDIVDDREGELNLDVAERILRWHAEAIGRCVELSSASDV